MIDIDHRIMTPPFLRRQSQSAVNSATAVNVWDLRIVQPNVSQVSGRVLHSLEHMLAVSMRRDSDAVVNVGPLGCRTGHYIVALDSLSYGDLSECVASALAGITRAEAVPLANVRECGAAYYHSLAGAQNVAGWLLRHREAWRLDGSANGKTA